MAENEPSAQKDKDVQLLKIRYESELTELVGYAFLALIVYITVIFSYLFLLKAGYIIRGWI